MPHRFFSPEEVADYLHLDPCEVVRLVHHREIPHEMVRGRPTFQQIEIDSWATQRLLGMKADDVKTFHNASSAKHHNLSFSHTLIPELMKDSHIEAPLEVRTRSSAIRAMVDLADRTGLLFEPDDLREAIEEREELMSTALPGGFALMHPRHHAPYMFDDTFIVLGRAPRPVPFGCADGNNTDLFFLICGQDDRIHLHLLARLTMMFRHTELLTELHEAVGAHGMYDALLASEEEVIAKHIVG